MPIDLERARSLLPKLRRVLDDPAATGPEKAEAAKRIGALLSEHPDLGVEIREPPTEPPAPRGPVRSRNSIAEAMGASRRAGEAVAADLRESADRFTDAIEDILDEVDAWRR